MMVVFLIGFIQCIYWKTITGNFLFYSYVNPGEGFEFLSPYLLEVLLSFRKGWLVYTPIMIFALVGFFFLWKGNKQIFFSILFFFLINLYVVSSWSCWWYAGSFGQRALIPSYVLLSIPLGYFINAISLKRILYFSFGAVAILVIVLNIFQSWQMTQGILDISRNSREYYFRVFGKTKVTEEDKKLLLVNRSADGNDVFHESEYQKTLSLKLDYEVINNDTSRYSNTFFHSGNSSYILDSINRFSPALNCEYKQITSKSHAWLKITAWVYPVIETKHTYLVAAFHHNDYPYQYRTTSTEKLSLKLKEWNLITMYYMTPEVRKKTDKLGIYFWNAGKEKLFVDDITVEIFEPKFDPSIF